VILILVLSFFLILSAYVVSALNSVASAERFVNQIYLKQQAYHALTSLIPLIVQGLKEEDQSVDSLSDAWAMPLEVKTDKGTLTVTIYDEDRFFNLNYLLKDESYKRVFERLLTLLEIDTIYLDSVLTWLGKGYSSTQKYPSKGAEMDSPYELIYTGFSEEDLYGKEIGSITYPGLLSLVTTYSSGKININTAPKYIIMALDPAIDSALADRIISYRQSKPFKRVEDLILVEGVTLDILYRIEKIVDVKSSHFRVIVTLKSGDVETTLELIYDRNNDKIVYKRIY